MPRRGLFYNDRALMKHVAVGELYVLFADSVVGCFPSLEGFAGGSELSAVPCRSVHALGNDADLPWKDSDLVREL